MWKVQHRSKYWSKKCEFRGIEFDSTHERNHFILLCDREKKGEISCLRRQTPFLLIPQTTRTIEVQLKTKVRQETRVVEQEARYHNDFTYKEGDKYVCEEYKSEMTAKLADYILRRKLMIRKIYEHNRKGRSQWVFREVVYRKGGKTTTEDK